MKCKLSKKCEFGNLCKYATRHDSLTVLGCSSFKTKKPMTEQEYLQTCNTEQLAEWIASVVQKAISIKENNGIVMLESAIWWEEWLKRPHKE